MYQSNETPLTKTIRNSKILSKDEEYKLAMDWSQNQDRKAVDKLAKSHLKLVQKIAKGYHGYGLPISDLVAEGSIGLMHAFKHFEPKKGFRFSTYAMWWVKASIQEYVLKTWSMVRIGTTAAQKKLFFSLKKTKEELNKLDNDDYLSDEKILKIANKLGVSEKEVRDMDQRISSKDSSLQVTFNNDDDNTEWQDWLPDNKESPEQIALHEDQLDKRKIILEDALKVLNERDRKVLISRRMTEPPKTLDELSSELGLSREGIRQIEIKSFETLRKYFKSKASDLI